MSDVRRIFLVQAIRAFLYGFGSIVIGASLAASGLDAVAVGAVFTAMLIGVAIGSLAVGRWGDRIGRRRTYVALLALMGVAGAAFAVTENAWILVLAALTGTLSTDANESGPITTVEQSMLASTPPAERARVYGRYNAVAYSPARWGRWRREVPRRCAASSRRSPPTSAGCSSSRSARRPVRSSPAV